MNVFFQLVVCDTVIFAQYVERRGSLEPPLCSLSEKTIMYTSVKSIFSQYKARFFRFSLQGHVYVVDIARAEFQFNMFRLLPNMQLEKNQRWEMLSVLFWHYSVWNSDRLNTVCAIYASGLASLFKVHLHAFYELLPFNNYAHKMQIKHQELYYK